MDNQELRELRESFPGIRPIHKPGRAMLHLVDIRWPQFTHCGQVTVDSTIDFEGPDIRTMLFCRGCEKWGNGLVAGLGG